MFKFPNLQRCKGTLAGKTKKNKIQFTFETKVLI